MFFLSSFLPRSFYPAYVTTKHTSTNRRVAVAVSLSSARVRARLSLISPEHHAFRASKSLLRLCLVVFCRPCLPPLQGAVCWPSWPPGLFARSGAAGSGRWRGLRVRERRRGGRLGVRSDRRVARCYLGLLSSTPARKIAFATPVNLPFRFDWSQLCPPSRAPKHDTRRG